MKNQYEVLSPWAEADSMLIRSISPRLEDLNNKTIGLFCSKYKVASLSILKTVERKLKERFTNLKFSLFDFRFNMEVTEASLKDAFDDWVRGVDAVVAAVGD